MDSGVLFTTREGDLELKGESKSVDYSVDTAPKVGEDEELSLKETEQLITGKNVGTEFNNTAIELDDNIIIEERENKIDFQQYALKNVKEGVDDYDVVVKKQLNELEPEIPDGSITTAKLADGVITNDKLAENAVTDGKIASNAINNTEIKDNQITPNKLNWSEFGNQTVSIVKNDVAEDEEFGKITVTKAGTYFIIASGFMNYAGSSTAYPGVRLYINTDSVTSASVGPTTAVQLNPTVTSVQQLNVGDEVKLVARNATLSCWQGSMTIIRIN